MNKISQVNEQSPVAPKKTHPNNSNLEVFTWIKIDVFFGAKYHSDFLKLKLSSTFSGNRSLCRFYGFRVIDKKVSFFVDNQKFANHLISLSNKIKIPHTNRLLTIKKCHGLPKIVLTNDQKERIREALIERFDKNRNVLNLDRFHNDPKFESQICCLYVPEVMRFVFKEIVKQNLEIAELILSNNRIRHFTFIEKYTAKLQSLKSLDISNNCIRSINCLKAFAGLPVIKLNTTNTSLTRLLKKENSRERTELKKIFDKLQCLNDRMIFVDDLEMLELKIDEKPSNAIAPPEENLLFASSEEAQSRAYLFLQQYIDAHEQNPELLMNAYAFNCTFEFQHNFSSKHSENNSFSVIQRLLQFPKLKYDRDSLIVNTIQCTPQSVQVVFDGVIEDCETHVKRKFSKLLTLVPYKTGIQIQNEIFRLVIEAPDN